MARKPKRDKFDRMAERICHYAGKDYICPSVYLSQKIAAALRRVDRAGRDDVLKGEYPGLYPLKRRRKP
jgi:hypothetical protein